MASSLDKLKKVDLIALVEQKNHQLSETEGRYEEAEAINEQLRTENAELMDVLARAALTANVTANCKRANLVLRDVYKMLETYLYVERDPNKEDE